MSSANGTGRIHRVHFSCRAPLPRGSTLHVCLLKDADKSTNLVEMVTSPAEYPIWRTRRPVVVTDVSGVGPADGAAGGTSVAYRYCSVSYNVGGSSGIVHPSESTNSMTSFAASLHDITNSDGIGQHGVIIQVEDPWKMDHIRSSSAPSVISSQSFANFADDSGEDRTGINVQPTQYQKISQSPFRSCMVLATEKGSDIADIWNSTSDATFQPYLKIQEDANAVEDQSSGGSERGKESNERERTFLYLVCFHLPITVSLSPFFLIWRSYFLVSN